MIFRRAKSNISRYSPISILGRVAVILIVVVCSSTNWNSILSSSSIDVSQGSSRFAAVHALSSIRMSSSTSPLSSTTTTTTTTTIRLPSSMISPFKAAQLRTIVTTAAQQDVVLQQQDEKEDSSSSSLDLNGLVWLEHLNFVVGPGSFGKRQARYFYLDVLGCTADKSKSFHVNLGQQQFHLKEATPPETQAQSVCGSIGVAVPDLSALKERVQKALGEASSSSSLSVAETSDEDDGGDGGWLLKDTEFDLLEDERNSLTISCPWGNIFRCYPAVDDDDDTDMSSTSLTQNKMTVMHSVEAKGMYSPNRMAVRTQPGIRFVEVVVPSSTTTSPTLEGLERFYRDVVHCTCHRVPIPTPPPPSSSSLLDDNDADYDGGSQWCLVVSIGPGVHLVLVEQQQKQQKQQERRHLHSALDRMQGVHMCVYTDDFRGLYDRLKALDLIWTNPRFTHLDSCDTWDEAFHSRTLRFRYLVDPQERMGGVGVMEGGDGSGDIDTAKSRRNCNSDHYTPLLELEHETRPMRHGQYLKVPYYVPR